MTERQRKIVQMAQRAHDNGDCACADTVTITISRDLARSLAEEWVPIDDDDPMIELFDACRRELDLSSDA